LIFAGLKVGVLALSEEHRLKLIMNTTNEM